MNVLDLLAESERDISCLGNLLFYLEQGVDVADEAQLDHMDEILLIFSLLLLVVGVAGTVSDI